MPDSELGATRRHSRDLESHRLSSGLAIDNVRQVGELDLRWARPILSTSLRRTMVPTAHLSERPPAAELASRETATHPQDTESLSTGQLADPQWSITRPAVVSSGTLCHMPRDRHVVNVTHVALMRGTCARGTSQIDERAVDLARHLASTRRARRRTGPCRTR